MTPYQRVTQYLPVNKTIKRKEIAECIKNCYNSVRTCITRHILWSGYKITQHKLLMGKGNYKMIAFMEILQKLVFKRV